MLKENEETKKFSLILNKYCTKEMQNRIQTHPKYETELVYKPDLFDQRNQSVDTRYSKGTMPNLVNCIAIKQMNQHQIVRG